MPGADPPAPSVPAEDPAVFYVVFMTTTCTSPEQVRRETPEALAAHLRRSRELHAQGRLVLAGAFTDRPGEPVSAMGILRTRADAEDYARHDPFLEAGLISDWHIREWANMLR